MLLPQYNIHTPSQVLVHKTFMKSWSRRQCDVSGVIRLNTKCCRVMDTEKGASGLIWYSQDAKKITVSSVPWFSETVYSLHRGMKQQSSLLPHWTLKAHTPVIAANSSYLKSYVRQPVTTMNTSSTLSPSFTKKNKLRETPVSCHLY